MTSTSRVRRGALRSLSTLVAVGLIAACVSACGGSSSSGQNSGGHSSSLPTMPRGNAPTGKLSTYLIYSDSNHGGMVVLEADTPAALVDKASVQLCGQYPVIVTYDPTAGAQGGQTQGRLFMTCNFHGN